MRLDNRVLLGVEKPARYTGGELNSISKDPGSVRLRVALAFPDLYEIGMSNLGSRILYDILNRREDIYAERVYTPWIDMMKTMRSHSIPLFSIETRTPLREFDIIGFTLAYELCYTNVLAMLDLASIPLRSSHRGEGDPIVIAGGACAFNPEPMADFIDAFAVGDGEEVILEIADGVIRSKERGSDRREVLEGLSEIEGVYVPSIHPVVYGKEGDVLEIPRRVPRRIVSDLDSQPYPTEPIVPYIDITHDRIVLEIMRGCTRGCRFCQAGMIYRPVRERSRAKLVALADASLASTGYGDISLMSLSSTDYSDIQSLTENLIDRYRNDRVGISLSSLRIDAFDVDLAKRIESVRKSGLTFAPEAGTDRLRRVINKGVSEENMLSAAESAFKAGWRRLKLYFMIGLPTETDEDLQGIIDTVRKVLKIGRAYSPKVKVAVSVSSFVPKPHTPFQWEEQIDIPEMKRRQKILEEGLRDRRVELKFHPAEASYLEGILSRGNRSIGEAILSAFETGAVFDQWGELFRYSTWEDAFRRCNVDPHSYTRSRSLDEILPWDVIDSRIKKEFLIDEREKALEEVPTPDCRWDVCTLCGAC
ncbi:MAG: TIGR03960 family B12-binding radical SAM protein [bacterium]